MVREDLENDKWIDISYSLSGASSILIGLKEDFKKYAEALGWEVDVDKKGKVDIDGERVYDVKILPKDKKISPEEFRDKLDLITGFAQSIYYDVHYKGVSQEDIPNAKLSLQLYEKENECIYRIIYASVLIIEAPLKKVILLSKLHPNLSRAIFFQNDPREIYERAIKVFEKILTTEDNRKKAEHMIEAMEANGIDKIKPRHRRWKFNL